MVLALELADGFFNQSTLECTPEKSVVSPSSVTAYPPGVRSNVSNRFPAATKTMLPSVEGVAK